ncbi:MAG: pyridoxamine 5'-phosphate oxidase family protein [Armatimonadetes bacterium]|nr:pyridoxamine 5'-phosphate oxidase family protein [Armatimonadota bacterium]
MGDSKHTPSQEREHWRRARELPEYVFSAWCKPARALNPVAVLATSDADGTPRTAPFGSLRAVTPRLLRLISMGYHDTYANLRRDGRVSVSLLAPPDIAVSVRGRARVIREHMEVNRDSAVIEIDIEEVKNDMAGRIAIESGISISPRGGSREWFDAVLGELEGM